uniref:WD40 repeat domain-containing protein n=1 Tax=Ignisphaera aggregans TaxID=334771 RepID=A0A7C4D2F6_9CREN
MNSKINILSIVVVIIVLVSLVTTLVSADRDAMYSIDVEMVRRLKILPGDDKPYCVAERDRFIYVAGIGDNGDVAYVFKMDKDRGYIQKVWNMGRKGCPIELHDCGFIGDKLYVIGIDCQDSRDTSWMFLVFNENLTLLLNVRENPTPKEDWVHAFTSDGEYIYAVGAVNGTGGYKTVMVWQWRVEKRRLWDLRLVSSYTSREIYGGRPFDIEINPITNHLWIVGTNRKPYDKIFMWSIMILDKDLKPVKEYTLLEELQGQALTICFDKHGYAYIGGDDAVIKMDIDGNIVDIRRYTNMTFSKSLCINDLIFMVGDVLKQNRTRHQIAVLMDTNLNILSIKDLHDPTNATSSYFDIGSLAFDGRYIYVAGHEEVIRLENRFGWVIYKLSLKRDGEIITSTPKTISPVVPLNASQFAQISDILKYITLPIVIIALAVGFIVLRYKKTKNRSKTMKKHK